jgi:ribA/ribD-fused uncharacterized protein
MTKYPHNNACKETDDAVYFYTPKHYCLDNFAAFSIDIWGKTFATSEHAYMWKKFAVSAPEVATQILEATSPNAVKKISDAHKADVAKDFDKLAVMEEILNAKLAQHEKVRRVLKETGEKTIYENSPTDEYWGAGESGNGQNKLGELWMKLRNII